MCVQFGFINEFAICDVQCFGNERRVWYIEVNSSDELDNEFLLINKF